MSVRDWAQVTSGAARLFWGGNDLGHTAGPVELKMTPRLREVRADCFGETMVDAVQIGLVIEVRARLAEWTLATVRLACPLGVAGAGAVAVGPVPGTRLRAAAAELAIHPAELDDATATHDMTFPLAAATGALAVAWQPGTERLFNVTFAILPDAAQEAGEELGSLHAPSE